MKNRFKILFISFLLVTLITRIDAATLSLRYSLTGIQGELKQKVTERLNNDLQIYTDKQLIVDDITAFCNQSEVEIKETLMLYGYFKPTINRQLIKQDHRWTIAYDISPGSPLIINSINLKIIGEGHHDSSFQSLLHNFSLQKGQILNAKAYKFAKQTLSNLATERGYFSAHFEKSTILIDMKRYQADIILHYDTGPRSYFGSVQFSPTPLCEKLLRRFIPFSPSTPYHNDDVMKLQENLSNSNYFQQVIVTPQPENAKDLQVPIVVDLKMRKAKQYTAGFGFGTDTGLRALAGLQLRYLNCWGHRLESILQISQLQQHFQAAYIIPGRHPATDQYKFSATGEHEDLDTSGQFSSLKLEASDVRLLPHDWQQVISIYLLNEYSKPTDQPGINSTLLLPSINWSKLKVDDLSRPNQGYRFNFLMRGASKVILDNTDFLQAQAQLKTIYPLTNNTRVVTSESIGYTAIDDFKKLPLSLQFFAGGSQSVRGYKYKGIGPGRALLTASVELQQRLKGDFYGTLFMDAGSVDDTLAAHLRKSIGIGLLWRSPVGAVALSVGQTLDIPGHPRMIQFSMGPEL